MEQTAWHLPHPDTQPEFYADIPVKRLIAWVIDSILIGVVTLFLVMLTGFLGLFFLPFLFLTVGFFYRWMTIAGGSATLGMRLVAIEFRDAEGRLFGGQTAGLHTLGYSISFAFPVLQLISVVMMVASPRAQGLTDQVLGSVAINRRAMG